MERLKLPNIDIKIDDSARKDALRLDPIVIDFLKENNLELDEVTLLSLLEQYSQSVKLCAACTGLDHCKQSIKGHKMSLKVISGQLFDEIVLCKYQVLKKEKDSFLKNIVYSDIPIKDKYLRMSDLKDLSKEASVFGDLVRLLANAIASKQKTGYYLSGDMGIGKTYITTAFINEVANRGYSAAFINSNAFASNMRRLVSSDNYRYNELLEEIKNVEYLAIDDLGAENISGFVRDDLLFNILDYRLGAELFTIFTSNLPLDNLEKSMAETSHDGSMLKARRIKERIEALAKEVVLQGENRRLKA